MTDDTVTLTIAGQKWSGWQGVHIQRGIETCPPTFDLMLTTKFPNQPEAAVPPQAGAPVVVSVGGTTVITGYADRMIPSFSPQGTALRAVGRGRCADLVDCSAIADNSQFLNRSILQIAQLVTARYGISVSQVDQGNPASGSVFAADGHVIPQLNVSLSDTPWNIIEQMCRFAALLCYEDTNGRVVLTSVGTQNHASGFQRGVNVQAASAMSAMDMRYGEYICVNLSVDPLMQIDPPGTGLGMTPDNIAATQYDPAALALKQYNGSLRNRVLLVVSEQGQNLPAIAQRRVDWEAARRFGRGNMVTVTCDSWRDSAGTLWTPNQLARVDLPALGVSDTWLIADVAFVTDLARGKVAEVTLMPPAAFVPAPPPVLPNAALNTAIAPAAPAAAAP